MSDSKPVSVSESSAFFTSERATEGIMLPLYLPTGVQTDKWIRVRGVDSDEFRKADARLRRGMIALGEIEDIPTREAAFEDHKRKTIAALVMDWNLAEACTEENVVEFLRKAPQIADKIDRVATDRALFFRQKPFDSASGQSGSGDSNGAQKAPSNLSESRSNRRGKRSE